jgi:hypothetical protein
VLLPYSSSPLKHVHCCLHLAQLLLLLLPLLVRLHTTSSTMLAWLLQLLNLCHDCTCSCGVRISSL